MISLQRRIFSILLLVIIQSCTKDKTPHPIDNTPAVCDTLNASYAACIKPVFKTYCYQCHSDSASQNGTIAFDIETFSSLKFYLNNYYHNDSIYGSKFYHIIAQTPGVIRMPPTGKLPDEDLTVVLHWLQRGAPQN